MSDSERLDERDEILYEEDAEDGSCDVYPIRLEARPPTTAGAKVRQTTSEEGVGEPSLLFQCPGCQEPHRVATNRWTWNGSMEAPTFSPSLLVRSGHHVPGHREGVDNCWCTYNREHPDEPAPFSCSVCHSFIRDGRIEFLSDCTHGLAGQKVEIPAWESRQ